MPTTTTSITWSISSTGKRTSIPNSRRTITSSRSSGREGESAGYVDKWIVYGRVDSKQLFSACELTVEPGRSITIKDPGAYGLIVVQGSGLIGKLAVDSPNFIRFGESHRRRGLRDREARRRGCLVPQHRQRAVCEPSLLRAGYAFETCRLSAITPRKPSEVRAMSVALLSPPAVGSENGEQRFVIGSVTWDAYVKISDALDDQPGLRMIYCDGRLVFVGKSRRHAWISDSLGHLVMAIAAQLDIPCEPAGEATYRREDKGAGLEGDRTFHVGVNALKMRGGKNYDFSTDPPPDLAIEVEVSHPADEAMFAWGRAGVPEVWRFDAASFTCSFWHRREDGTYEKNPVSACIPQLGSDDVVELIGRAQEIGTVPSLAQIPDWVDRVIRPRLEGGAE